MASGTGETIHVTLKVWRQDGPAAPGRFEGYQQAISADASFLEMLDQLNEHLNDNVNEPVAFESDCREGICGTCGVMINGRAHGPQRATATCQLHMRSFNDGDTLTVEPWRAKSFPIVKDLVVNRQSFDNIMESGGYVSVKTGGAPDANSTPVFKENAMIAHQ